MKKSQVFLERDSYRRRRLTDAIRLLPMLGLIVFMVPLLWPVQDGDTAGLSTSVALRFLFFGWILLAGLGFILWLKSRPASNEPS